MSIEPRLIIGDCVEVLPTLEPDSISAVVTDPPYGLEFMGVGWDKFRKPTERDQTASKHPHVSRAQPAAYVAGMAFQEWVTTWALELYRVLKPGGVLVAFGGTRTVHRLTSGIEDAGFEIRDLGLWLYRNGFPKNHDVAKAIDKRLGVEGEYGEWKRRPDNGQPAIASRMGESEGESIWHGQWREDDEARERNAKVYVPGSVEGREWAGWGTALKPSWEPWLLARKPLSSTVARNVLDHGTGALNIDATRAPFAEGDEDGYWPETDTPDHGELADPGYMKGWDGKGGSKHEGGRWPANLITLEDDRELRHFRSPVPHEADLCDVPKAKSSEKPWGPSTGRPETPTGNFLEDGKAIGYGTDGESHPTVKPLALMRHLIRLVVPPAGVVIDPFAGTGTTLEAAVLENRASIGIEKEAAYEALIRKRLGKPLQPGLGL